MNERELLRSCLIALVSTAASRAMHHDLIEKLGAALSASALAAPEHAAPVCPYIVTTDEGTSYCKLGAPPSVSWLHSLPESKDVPLPDFDSLSSVSPQAPTAFEEWADRQGLLSDQRTIAYAAWLSSADATIDKCRNAISYWCSNDADPRVVAIMELKGKQ